METGCFIEGETWCLAWLSCARLQGWAVHACRVELCTRAWLSCASVLVSVHFCVSACIHVRASTWWSHQGTMSMKENTKADIMNGFGVKGSTNKIPHYSSCVTSTWERHKSTCFPASFSCLLLSGTLQARWVKRSLRHGQAWPLFSCGIKFRLVFSMFCMFNSTVICLPGLYGLVISCGDEFRKQPLIELARAAASSISQMCL